jgi:histidinol phosphatase-like PHP family hydrolase
MLYNQIFFKSILDTVENHIVVIDKNGDIIFTNKSWNSFGENNHCITNASDFGKKLII